MKWQDLLHLLGGMTLFEASALLAGPDSPGEVRRQLSRWAASGRLIQLRRGLYVVAPPFAGEAPNLLALASRIRVPSYLSLQSALSYHGVIPESVPVVTSVTTGRPGQCDTPLGLFLYRHLKRDLFWGYREVDLEAGQKSFVATAEKALLDHYYLTPGVIDSSFVRELRLDPDNLDVECLRSFAKRAAKPRLTRAVDLTIRILEEDRTGERRL
jgi:predicted transcriptional regulator of viral defense system